MSYINALIDFWAFTNNLFSNPDPENNLTNWSPVNGVTITQDGTNLLIGSFAAKIVLTGTNPNGVAMLGSGTNSLIPVSASTGYTLVWYVYATGSAIGITLTPRVLWYQNDGVTNTGTSTGSGVTLVSGWNRILMTANSPALTALASPVLYDLSTSDNGKAIWVQWPFFGLASNFFTLQDPTPVPGNRFVNWNPDVARAVDRETVVGTGLISEFLYRRDGIATFEVQHLTPAQLGTAASLKDTLLGGIGYAVVTTADNNNAEIGRAHV